VPYDRNCRDTGSRLDWCLVKARVNRKILSLDLKTGRQSLKSHVCGSDFQRDGADKRKSRLEKSVLVNGMISSGMTNECGVQLQTRSVILSHR